MGAILIGMPKHEDASRIADLLRNGGVVEECLVCTMGSEILRKEEEFDASLVICTKHFSDMGYEEMVSYLPTSVSVLLLTKDSSLSPFAANVIRLLMPFKVDDLLSTVRMLLPYQSFYERKKKKTRPPSEQEVIDKAKMVLMERNEMTEPDAYRYLQKVSMDSGRSLLESAQMILMMDGG